MLIFYHRNIWDVFCNLCLQLIIPTSEERVHVCYMHSVRVEVGKKGFKYPAALPRRRTSEVSSLGEALPRGMNTLY